MLKTIKKVVSCTLCLSLLVGCSSGDQTKESSSVKKDEQSAVVLTEKGHTVSIAKKKEETVNVTADAYGTPTETTVQVLLKDANSSDLIKDYTDLTDIKNTKGDEEFTLKTNGTLLWENHDEDITYEGTSDDDLPVDIKITYKLNGKKISADKLKGKSGKVTIRFDYTNNETKIINGEGVYVPFTAVSAVMLSDDVFKNVKVTNGALTSMSDTTVAVGMVFPGLEDSLELNRYDLSDDIDIPSYFEVKADVTGFELDYTATVVTSGLLKDVDLSQLDDISDLSDALSALNKASSKLVKGSAQLYSGANKFSQYFDQYVEGVSQVSDGSKTLSSALSSLDEQTSSISDTATTYLKEIKKIKDMLDEEEFKKWMEESGLDYADINSAVTSISEQAESLKTVLETLSSTLKAYSNYNDAITKAVEALEALDLDRLESQIESDAIAATKKSVSDALSDVELTDEQREAILSAVESGIKEGVDLKDTISKINEQLNTIKQASAQLDEIDTSDIDSLIASMSQQMATIEEALQAYSQDLSEIDVSALFKVLDVDVDQLSAQLKAYASGVSQLSDGAQQLSEGTETLSSTGKILAKNYKTLVKGMKAMASGLKLFDKKGISELTNMGTDDLEDLANRLKLLKKADKSYDNFSGKLDEEESSVNFIIETEEIKADD